MTSPRVTSGVQREAGAEAAGAAEGARAARGGPCRRQRRQERRQERRQRQRRVPAPRDPAFLRSFRPRAAPARGGGADSPPGAPGAAAATMSSPSPGKRRMDTDVVKLYPCRAPPGAHGGRGSLPPPTAGPAEGWEGGGHGGAPLGSPPKPPHSHPLGLSAELGVGSVLPLLTRRGLTPSFAVFWGVYPPLWLDRLPWGCLCRPPLGDAPPIWVPRTPLACPGQGEEGERAVPAATAQRKAFVGLIIIIYSSISPLGSRSFWCRLRD